MNKLTILPNDENHEPERQLNDISLALQAINSWANRLANEVNGISAISSSSSSGISAAVFPLIWDATSQTVSIAPYYLPLTGGIMSGNITYGAASTYTIASSGTPLLSIWADNINGQPARTMHSVVPSGSINGTNTVFTIPNAPNGFIAVWDNGVRLCESGTYTPFDYSVSGSTINFVSAPVSGTRLLIDYSY